jgi:plasmid stabilization system protein ParE
MLRELEAMDGARRRAVVRDLLSEFDKLSDVRRQGTPR